MPKQHLIPQKFPLYSRVFQLLSRLKYCMHTNTNQYPTLALFYAVCSFASKTACILKVDICIQNIPSLEMKNIFARGNTRIVLLVSYILLETL